MKQSEKLMVVSLAGLLGAFGVVPAIWKALREPINQAEVKLLASESRMGKAQDNFDAAMVEITKMQEFKVRSLSSNPSQAANAYQQWLADLTEVVAKFENPEVTPDRISPSRDNTFVAIRIRISGEATLEQLREFLYRFHRANVLHRVVTLTVDSLDSTQRPLLRIDMTVEALSLKSAPEKASTTLFPRTELLSDASSGQLDVIHINTFADTPFEVRVGDRFVNVIEKSKQLWDLEGEIPVLAAGAKVTLIEPKPAKAAPNTAATPSTKTSKPVDAAKTSASDRVAKKPAMANKPAAAEVELLEEIKAGATYITVKSTAAFPRVPFDVKIGDKTLKVTRRSESWMVDDQQFRASKGTTIEVSTVHPDFREATLADFDALVSKNPFSKPVPLRPRLDLIGEKVVRRGSSTTLTARASGYDERPGKATVELTSELIAGMTFEAGELKWQPPQDFAAGRYDVVFKASAPGLSKPLEETFSVSLVDANDAPSVSVPNNVFATIGQLVTIQLLASDKETPTELTYSFADGAPEGAAIDPKSGLISWTPAGTAQPGNVEIPVLVTDVGSPQQSTSAKVVVRLQDDASQFTFLTGFVSTESDRQAWLYDRSTNKRLILREGGILKYGSFNALVLLIDREFVLVQQNDETWQIDVGKNLRDAKMIAKAEPKKQAEPTSDGADPKDPLPATTKDPEVKTTVGDVEKNTPASDAAPTVVPAATDSGTAPKEPAAKDAADPKSPEPKTTESKAGEAKGPPASAPPADSTETKVAEPKDARKEPAPKVDEPKVAPAEPAAKAVEPKADSPKEPAPQSPPAKE